MNSFIGLLCNWDKLPILLLVIILVFCYILYKAQYKPDNFDLRDLIIDSDTKVISLSKFGQLASLILGSWGFVYLTLHDKLTELYFTTYMAAYASTMVINKAISVYDKSANKVNKKIQTSAPENT